VDKVMKIKAAYGSKQVTIIAFVPAYDNCVKAVYVSGDGKIGTCHADNCLLTITDENYIPQDRSTRKIR
jgi:hypothetical protein